MSRKLVAIVGAGAAAMLLNWVPYFEGTILRGYTDPIGVVTACTGHTKTAVLGRPYTPAECEALLLGDLADHAAGVEACVTEPLTVGQRAAFVSFAFNVGVDAFCRSTLTRKANAGDMPGACAELSRWVYADGQRLPGLVTRRQIERDMCEGRVAESGMAG